MAETHLEFTIIDTYFRPLADPEAGSLGLRDDAAVFDPPAGRSLVVTTDCVVAGVHYLQDDDGGDVAAKALRVNLSDLAAMGAEPLGYLLATAFSRETSDDWLRAFADALGEDQAHYGIRLLGGDTVLTPGPTTITVTALGHLPQGSAMTRSGARPGDTVFVTGTIGDGALGLKAATGETIAGVDGDDAAALATRYRRPEPRLAAGIAVRGQATAAADVSDGLIADLGHICEESGLSARIEADRVPLSPAARKAIDAEPGLLGPLLTGGDDYELVFTGPASLGAHLNDLARDAGVPISVIGTVDDAGTRGSVTVVDGAGRPIDLPKAIGYVHNW